MIDVQAVRSWEFPPLTQAYDSSDAILYALALGYGQNPCDDQELRYVYERDLTVVPTFANVLCHPGFWISDPRTGIDFKRALHGEHRMEFHGPLPKHGRVRSSTKVLDVIDKGPGRGALLILERALHDDVTDMLLARIEQHTLCRGDGGFSLADCSPSGPATTAVQPLPERAPDIVIDLATLPQAALLYRLSADPNPLHADPNAARAAGFDRPILHGLCTFGIACRAVLQACANGNPANLASLSGRFSAPVFPGDTLRTEIWIEGRGALRLQCRVPNREAVVLVNGAATVST